MELENLFSPIHPRSRYGNGLPTNWRPTSGTQLFDQISLPRQSSPSGRAKSSNTAKYPSLSEYSVNGNILKFKKLKCCHISIRIYMQNWIPSNLFFCQIRVPEPKPKPEKIRNLEKRSWNSYYCLLQVNWNAIALKLYYWLFRVNCNGKAMKLSEVLAWKNFKWWLNRVSPIGIEIPQIFKIKSLVRNYCYCD